MRYAEDMFAFVMRSAGNLRAFFALCDFCGLGSGTTNNVAKSFVEFTGVDREGDTCGHRPARSMLPSFPTGAR